MQSLIEERVQDYHGFKELSKKNQHMIEKNREK